jgi:hypothetical protein
MNMKKCRLVMILGAFCFSVPAAGQYAHLPVVNAYITSGAYSGDFLDAFSFISNPACLAGVKGILAGLVAERKWMLQALDNYNLAAASPLGNGGIGFSLQKSGDIHYSEQSVELAYGKNLGRLELGIRFGYMNEVASGYPGHGFGYSGIGIRVHVSENLITGWELDLPVFGKAGKLNPERAPQSFRMGFGYQWGTDLFLACQIIKSTGFPLNVLGSLAYRYSEQFFFSFGINGDSGSLVFQSGWEKHQLCIQLYAAFEPVLGFSPGLVILWKGKNKKE